MVGRIAWEPLPPPSGSLDHVLRKFDSFRRSVRLVAASREEQHSPNQPVGHVAPGDVLPKRVRRRRSVDRQVGLVDVRVVLFVVVARDVRQLGTAGEQLK